MKIAAVKYHNTLPFLNGLKQSGLDSEVELVLDHPANCALLLKEGAVDIALCPVGALVDFQEYHLITDYGIGCSGPVRTVAVYSHRPIHNLRFVVLTPESRTSNLLVQALDCLHWQYQLEFCSEVPKGVDPEDVGILSIGDRCFALEKEFPHACDLGACWMEYTGLPFVFACWTSLTPVEKSWEDRLNDAFAAGVRMIDQMVLSSSNGVDIRHYLHHNIDFKLDTAKRKAIELFLNTARNLHTLSGHAVEDTFR